MPVAALQMLWGKLYAVYDPYLVQSAIRSRALSFEAFEEQFAQQLFNADKSTNIKITAPGVLVRFTDAIHGNMQPKIAYIMNDTALKYISRILEDIDVKGVDVPNMYLWERDLLTLATMKALFGDHSPFEKDHSLVQTLWYEAPE